jgi:hypothetical protein
VLEKTSARIEDFKELEGEVRALRTAVGVLESEVRASRELVCGLVRMVAMS